MAACPKPMHTAKIQKYKFGFIVLPRCQPTGWTVDTSRY
jgi:hypothetical protein